MSLMNAGSGNTRSKSWSAYWSTGRLHSCADGGGGNYQGVIGDFWKDIAGRIGKGTRILDLATGNGPLPLLFWDQKGDDVEIDAVDQAVVSPGWYRPELQRRMRFHSGIAMESLPFVGASFDLVVSQYGFEYADRAEAISECVRVAAPDASIVLVLHHSASVLVSVGRAELPHYDWLLGRTGLFEAARAVIPVLGRVRGGLDVGAVDASRARSDYNRAMSELSAAIAGSSAPDVLIEARAVVHALVVDAWPGTIETSLQALAAYSEQLAGARLRTAEMVDAAIDRPGLAAMVEQFSDALPGSVIETGELAQAEGVLGWFLDVSAGGLTRRLGSAASTS